MHGVGAEPLLTRSVLPPMIGSEGNRLIESSTLGSARRSRDKGALADLTRGWSFSPASQSRGRLGVFQSQYFGQEQLDRLFTSSASHRRRFERDRRLIYRRVSSGAVNLPAPRFGMFRPVFDDHGIVVGLEFKEHTSQYATPSPPTLAVNPPSGVRCPRPIDLRSPIDPESSHRTNQARGPTEYRQGILVTMVSLQVGGEERSVIGR